MMEVNNEDTTISIFFRDLFLQLLKFRRIILQMKRLPFFLLIAMFHIMLQVLTYLRICSIDIKPRLNHMYLQIKPNFPLNY